MADEEVELLHPELTAIRDWQSFSSLSTYIRCPLQYMFRYVEGIKTPPAIAMARGSAGHKGLETNYKQKITTRKDLPVDTVLDAVRDTFTQIEPLIQDWEDQKPGQVKDNVIKRVRKYQEDFAPDIQPVECEKEFILNIGKHKMKLYRDLKDENNTIRDSKFSDKARSQSQTDNDLQGTIYTFVDSTPNFAFDCVTTNGVKTTVGKRTQQQWDQLVNIYIPRIIRNIEMSTENGNFMPCDPASWAHTPKFCGYWNICPAGGLNTNKVVVDMGQLTPDEHIKFDSLF